MLLAPSSTVGAAAAASTAAIALLPFSLALPVAPAEALPTCEEQVPSGAFVLRPTYRRRMQLNKTTFTALSHTKL